MLVLDNVSSGYGTALAARKVSLEVQKGEIVALIGPNGAGKTTLLRTIAGLLSPRSGGIVFQSKPIAGLAAHKIVRLGLALVPEGRQVFDRLSTKDNLMLGAYPISNSKKVEELLENVFCLFPILKERETQHAGTLSGGEQQMLAIGRGLMSDPRMLLLDEPSMGLAPNLVEKVFQFIRTLNSEAGLTVLVSEQNAFQALSVAERAYVMESGALVTSGTARELTEKDEIRRKYLAESTEARA